MLITTTFALIGKYGLIPGTGTGYYGPYGYPNYNSFRPHGYPSYSNYGFYQDRYYNGLPVGNFNGYPHGGYYPGLGPRYPSYPSGGYYPGPYGPSGGYPGYGYGPTSRPFLPYYK